MSSDGRIEIDAAISDGDYEKALNKMESISKKVAQKAEKNLLEISSSLDNVGKSAERATSKASGIKIEPSAHGIGRAEKELAALVAEMEKTSVAADALQEDLNNALSAGGDSEYTQAIRRQLDDAVKSADQVSKKVWELEDALTSARQEMDGGAKSADKLGESFDDAGDAGDEAAKDINIMETALASMVMKGIAQAVSAMKELIESTYDYRVELAKAETNISRMGGDLEEAERYMRQFGKVSSDTSQNLAAVSNLLDTGLEGKNLEEAIKAVSGAVIAFPDQNVQRIAEGIQRTFGEGKAVGNFAELIRRTGGDVDRFNERMERATTDAQKQNIIMRELSRMGLAEVAEQFEELNPDLVAATDAQARYNEEAARLAEALQPAQTELDELRANLMGLVADFAEGHPELAGFVYTLTQFAGIALKVAAGILAIKVAIKGFSTWFGSAATGAGDTARNVTQAGNAAKGANMQFLSVAAGIALMAAGFAIAVVAVTELVKAFNGSNGSATEIAGGVAIIIGSLTAMLTVMALLSKTMGNNNTQFLIYSAGMLMMAGAVSLMLLALASLVGAMGESDIEVQDLANSISQIILTITGALAVMTMLGVVAKQAIPGLLALTLVIVSLAAAFAMLALAIQAIRGGPVPTVTTSGYAHGTSSATKGWRLVGENGPELVNFGGGEKVLTASQTMARQGALTSGGGRSITYYLGGVTIDAHNVKDFNDVVEMVQSESLQMKQGVNE